MPFTIRVMFYSCPIKSNALLLNPSINLIFPITIPMYTSSKGIVINNVFKVVWFNNVLIAPTQTQRSVHYSSQKYNSQISNFDIALSVIQQRMGIQKEQQQTVYLYPVSFGCPGFGHSARERLSIVSQSQCYGHSQDMSPVHKS